MATATIPVLLGTGDHASRPAAADVGSGGLYACSDHALIYQTDGSSWTTWADLARTFVQLFDSTLGSDTASFDVTSISGAYTGLVIDFALRSDRAANAGDAVRMRFNNDSGNNYGYSSAQHDGSATYYSQAAGVSSFAAICEASAATAPAGAAGIGRIEIPNYAGTTWHKGYTCVANTSLGDTAGNERVWSTGGRWRNTAAITRVTIAPVNGSNFKTGSRLTVYGLL